MLTLNTWKSKTSGEITFLLTLCKNTNSQTHTMTQGSIFSPNSTLSQMKNLSLTPNPLYSPSKWPLTTSSSNNSTPQLPTASSKSSENTLKITAFTLDLQRTPKTKISQNINMFSVLVLWLMIAEDTLIMKTTLDKKPWIKTDLCIKMSLSPSKINPSTLTWAKKLTITLLFATPMQRSLSLKMRKSNLIQGLTPLLVGHHTQKIIFQSSFPQTKTKTVLLIFRTLKMWKKSIKCTIICTRKVQKLLIYRIHFLAEILSCQKTSHP